MTTINRTQLLEQLNWRYATKQFDPTFRPVDVARQSMLQGQMAEERVSWIRWHRARVAP